MDGQESRMDIKPYIFQDLGLGKVATSKKADGTHFTPYIEEKPPLHKQHYDAQDLVDAERNGHKAGYEEGVAAGIEQGRSESHVVDQKLTEILGALNAKLDIFFQNFYSVIARSEEETRDLAYIIATKIAGDALKEDPYSNIEGLVRQCMDVVFSHADIRLTVHPDVEEPVWQRIEQLAEATSFQGKITVVGDASLSPHDCIVDWEGGGASLKHQETIRAIEVILTQAGVSTDVMLTAEEAGALEEGRNVSEEEQQAGAPEVEAEPAPAVEGEITEVEASPAEKQEGGADHDDANKD